MQAGDITKLGIAIVTITHADGTDYVRVCVTHRWASLEALHAEALPACPFCRVEFEERQGRARFDEIQRRLSDKYGHPKEAKRHDPTISGATDAPGPLTR